MYNLVLNFILKYCLLWSHLGPDSAQLIASFLPLAPPQP